MDELVERTFGDLTVRIDRPTCIGNEGCISLAPGVFRLDEDGICSFVEPGDGASRETLLEACRVCPVGVLSVVDEKGRTIVP